MLSQKHTFGMDMTVLERQQGRFRWLLQQQENDYVNQYNSLGSFAMSNDQFQGFFDHESMNGDVIDWKKQPELCLENPNVPKYHTLSLHGSDFVVNNKMEYGQAEVAVRSLEIDHCLSRTSSCQNGVVDAAKNEEVMPGDEDVALREIKQHNHSTDNSNKRKAESVAVEECDNKVKEAEVESKIKKKSSPEISADSSKENQKTSVLPKTDYIHVRARRGQATDSHSLAERARREKISKKMKCLQDLVPGCNKITGRAGMLDEIINYVQSLQRQVEFLSMKLAVLNPRQELNIDSFSGKEFPACIASFPAATVSSSSTANIPHPQLNLEQQQETGSELEPLTNPPLLVSAKTSSSLAFMRDLCFDSLAQVQPFWDDGSQNLQNLGFH